MKKGIYLSLACSLWMNAAEVELEMINIATKVDTEVIKDVSGDDIKSADLAEALFKQSPSVALSRRSGIANDIVVRGQRKDNINVTVDGTKVYGACPNRMDPPVSHILTNNVDYIEINEGPFNVEDFGVLSADVQIHTVKPSDEFEGEVNLGLGSWGYQKGAFSLSGGVAENVRVLLSGSTEKSGQYEDGDGNDFAEQIDNYIADNVSGSIPPSMADMMLMKTTYQDKYRDMDAYTKKTMMAKLFWDITDNQELRLSYTANRSDDVLYPSSKMDALYDDSDIYNIEYIAKDLGKYSKELNFQVYQSEVDHPMSNMYRKSAINQGAPHVMTHALTTKTQGAKLSNQFDINNHMITAGLDYSKRNWDGQFYMNGNAGMKSINDVDTENYALFLKDKIKMDKFVLDLGMRYDDTKITSQHPSATLQPDNEYNELNGYILGTYNKDENTKYYAGFGKSSRVPDARELYLMMMGTYVGTPDLENTVNYEFDIGAEKKYENATIKAKAFYSMLDDFIAYNADSTSNNLENVDATIWGVELSGTYIATDSVYFDYGMSYQRGKKKDPLTGQSDTDMPEIPPFKFNGAVNYDYDESLALRAEVIASNEWTDFDADNGEQELDAYAVLNLKGTKKFGNHFELTVGVDNLFDTTYAVTNTYKDITLLPTTSVDTNIMLLNEPGRYFYTNIKYKF